MARLFFFDAPRAIPPPPALPRPCARTRMGSDLRGGGGGVRCASIDCHDEGSREEEGVCLLCRTGIARTGRAPPCGSIAQRIGRKAAAAAAAGTIQSETDVSFHVRFGGVIWEARCRWGSMNSPPLRTPARDGSFWTRRSGKKGFRI